MARSQTNPDPTVPEENIRLHSFLRLGLFAAGAVVLAGIVYWIAPAQLPVAAWKFALVSAAAYVGYWLDRQLFPYNRPHTLATPEVLENPHVDPMGIILASAMLRRAIIVGAMMVSVSLAL